LVSDFSHGFSLPPIKGCGVSDRGAFEFGLDFVLALGDDLAEVVRELESKELIFPLILGLIAININTTVLALGIEEYMFSILGVDGFAVLLLLWSSISFVESLLEL
jgi:hypothetical protein